MKTGTVQDLLALRVQWRAAQRAAGDLARLGHADLATSMALEAEARGAEVFGVMLSCMFCRQPTPAEMQVGGEQGEHNATPGSIICGPCSAGIDAAVERASLVSDPGDLTVIDAGDVVMFITETGEALREHVQVADSRGRLIVRRISFSRRTGRPHASGQPDVRIMTTERYARGVATP